jgi:hypothetical protein
MEDNNFLSAVLIEDDSVTQRLWKINIANSKARLINKKIDSVGYYFPIGGNEYATFILGTTEFNHTLRLVDISSSTESIIDDSIKGCIKLIPGTKIISYVRLNANGTKEIVAYNTNLKSKNILLNLPEGADDYIWNNNYLYVPYFNIISVYKFNQIQYTLSDKLVERDLSESPIKNSRRPAISPDGKKLIIVGDDSKIK